MQTCSARRNWNDEVPRRLPVHPVRDRQRAGADADHQRGQQGHLLQHRSRPLGAGDVGLAEQRDQLDRRGSRGRSVRPLVGRRPVLEHAHDHASDRVRRAAVGQGAAIAAEPLGPGARVPRRRSPDVHGRSARDRLHQQRQGAAQDRLARQSRHLTILYRDLPVTRQENWPAPGPLSGHPKL